MKQNSWQLLHNPWSSAQMFRLRSHSNQAFQLQSLKGRFVMHGLILITFISKFLAPCCLKSLKNCQDCFRNFLFNMICRYFKGIDSLKIYLWEWNDTLVGCMRPACRLLTKICSVCEIWDSKGGGYKDHSLLVCDAQQHGRYFPIS
jgi:hypothetical protein